MTEPSNNIRDKRRINSAERFKSPEYWPFDSAYAVPITELPAETEIPSTTEPFVEHFEDPIFPAMAAVSSVTTDFDDIGQQGEWAGTLLTGAGTYTLTWVTDAASPSTRGTVARCRTTNSSAGKFYPVSNSINGTSTAGIKSGRVRVHYWSNTSNTAFFGIRFRVSNDSTNYYQLVTAYPSLGQTSFSKVVGGVATTIASQSLGSPAGPGIATDGTWHWVEFTFWEDTDAYGTRLYATIKHDFLSAHTDVYYQGPTSRQEYTSYFVDNDPDFSTPVGTEALYIYSNGAGNNPSVGFDFDEITVEKWD